MPESKDEFDAAWAQIVDDLTSGRGSADHAGRSPDGPDRAAGEPGGPSDSGTATPPGADDTPGDVPSEGGSRERPPVPEAPTDQQAGLDALFEPLRPRAEPPAEWTGETWEDEGHYVPPPPPELPEGTPVSRLAWSGVIGGPIVLLLIALTGWQPPSIVAYGAGLAFLAGFATLVWQLPEGREDGWDDGSRL